MRSVIRFAIAVSLLSACTDKSDTKPATEPVTNASPGDVWQPVVQTLTGSNRGLTIKAAGAAEFAQTNPGTTLEPGAHARTDATTLATLQLSDGTSIWLNHSTEIQLLADGPGLAVVVGQAVIDHHAPQDQRPGQTRAPRVILPTGEVVLTGTKLVVLADPTESSVGVSQGSVTVESGAQPMPVYAGEEVLLPRDGVPRVVAGSDFDEAFGWAERDVATERPVQVPRGLGKLVGKSPGGERERPLQLTKHNVTVRIQGNVAYTEVTEVFHNPTGETLEGLYRFPLPGDAQISRLALKVGNRMMEGEFLETRRAERIFRTIIDQWRDPAILKWKHGNQFELRIFPIEPRSSRLVTIGYAQTLRTAGDGYRYVYPMPRDDAGLASAGVFEFDARIAGSGDSPDNPTVQVLGYDATVTRDTETGSTRVAYRKDDFWASGDLTLRFARPRTAKEVQAWGFQGRDQKDDGFVAFTVRPTLPRAGNRQGRDFVIALDSSYSRQGLTMQLQKHLLPRLIAEMDRLDRVQVIACATSCVPVGAPEFAPVRVRTLDELTRAVDGVRPQGSTYTVEAVRVAAHLLARRPDTTRAAHIIYMTDGVTSAGELRPAQLGAAVRELLAPVGARLGIVDIGGDTDEANLDALARAGNGAVIRLDAGMSLTGHALRILKHHYGAVLANPEIQLPAGLERVHPQQLTSVASGDELTIVARAKGPITGQIILRGQLGAERFEKSWPVAVRPEARAGNAFIPRLWASHAIRDLELSAGSNQKEIIRLSKRYGVLSRFTTLLALESRDMMDEFGVRKRERDEWRAEGRPSKSDDKVAGGTESQEQGSFAESADESGDTTRSETQTKKKSAKSSRKPRSTPRNFDRADPGEMEKPSDMASAPSSSSGSTRPLTKPAGVGFSGRGKRRWFADEFKLRKPGQSPSKWERKNAQKRAKQFLAERANRSKRMRMIRAYVRASDIEQASTETKRWLQINPFDPEAVVQHAQLMAYRGDIAGAMHTLESAIDTAPRANWLQKRVRLAYQANGDTAMACAHAVAAQSLNRSSNSKSDKRDPRTILQCPSSTDMDSWSAKPIPTPAAVAAPGSSAKKLTGQLTIDINWTSPGDIDIQLLEPNGRLLSALSQRRRLKVAGVRGGNREQLALPSMRNGTYKIRLLRAQGTGTIRVRGKIKLDGKHMAIDQMVGAQPVVIAEAVRD